VVVSKVVVFEGLLLLVSLKTSVDYDILLGSDELRGFVLGRSHIHPLGVVSVAVVRVPGLPLQLIGGLLDEF